MTPFWAMPANLVLQAGAGTGKTHALVTLALHLFAGATARKEPVSPRRFIAFTFTEKAATELRERIVSRVHRLATNPSLADAKEDELATTLHALGLSAPDALHWKKVERELAASSIGTMHAFCTARLRRSALLLGLDPDFGVLDAVEANDLFEDALQRTVLDLLVAGDPGMRALVEFYELHATGPQSGLVDLARGTLEKIAEHGLEPSALLDPNHSDGAAAGQLDAAITLLLKAIGGLGELPSARQQKIAPAVAELRALATSTLDDDAITRLGALRSAIPNRPSHPAVVAIHDAIDAVGPALASRRAVPLITAFVRLLEAVNQRYRARKTALEALDFGDLQRVMRDALLTNPEFRRAENAAADALLVDEFQDTSALQLELVRLLSEPAPPGSAFERGKLCIVGDRKQSIYGFRGADVSVFSRLHEALVADDAGTNTVSLRKSYRSRPALVAFANGLFSRTMATAAASYDVAFTDTDALEAARPGEAGELAVELLSVPADNADDGREAEAKAVAARIEAMLGEGDAAFVLDRTSAGEVRRRVEGRDITLLFSKLTRVDIYTRALAERGIPHVVIGAGGLFASLEASDAWALLRCIDDPSDSLATAALLRSPWCAISDTNLTRLAVEGRGLLLAAMLRAPPTLDDGAETASLKALLTFVTQTRPDLDRLGAAGVFELALRQLRYVDACGLLDDRDPAASNVDRLRGELVLLDAAHLTPRSAIQSLADRIRDGQRAAAGLLAEESDPTCVRLMTVHRAKGLQFPVVFVCDAAGAPKTNNDAIVWDQALGLGLFVRVAEESQPSFNAKAVRDRLRDRDVAEAKRLFYVAVTRASDWLVVSGSVTARSPKDHWLLQASGDTSPRVRPWKQADSAPSLRARSLPVLHDVDALPEPIPASRLVATVTRMQDFGICPERHRLRHEVGLREFPPSPFAADDDDEADPPLGIFERGTLAHRLLERSLLADLPVSKLETLVRQEGYSPSTPALREVLDDVRAFLGSPFAAHLRAVPKTARFAEVPVLLEVPITDGVLALKGQLDLLTVTAEGIRVVDYKHARATKGAADRYAFQAKTYAVAAREALGRLDLPVITSLVFLRDHAAAPVDVVLTPDDLDAHLATLAGLGEDLRNSLATGHWDRIEPSECDRISCGYRPRCWGSPTRAPAQRGGEQHDEPSGGDDGTPGA